MSYALVHEGRVLLTCDKFYVGRFNAELADLDINSKIYPSMESQVPITIAESTQLLHYSEAYPVINQVTESYDGPAYEITADSVIARYSKRNLSLSIAKDRAADILRQTRYRYENSNIEINIPCVCASYLSSDILISKEFLPSSGKIVANTSRESRMIYVNKISIMADGKVNYKFTNGWFYISKAGLSIIASEIDKHVQRLFDLEASTAALIDACSNLDELDSIDLDPFISLMTNLGDV